MVPGDATSIHEAPASRAARNASTRRCWSSAWVISRSRVAQAGGDQVVGGQPDELQGAEIEAGERLVGSRLKASRPW